MSNIELGLGCTGSIEVKWLKTFANTAILRVEMPPQMIRAPFAGAERTAEVLGVSPERTHELILLAKQAVEEDPELKSLRSQRLNAKKKTASRRKKRR